LGGNFLYSSTKIPVQCQQWLGRAGREGGSRWVVLDQLHQVQYNGLYSIPTMDEIRALNSHYIGKYDKSALKPGTYWVPVP